LRESPNTWTSAFLKIQQRPFHKEGPSFDAAPLFNLITHLTMNDKDYSVEFSETSFWQKLTSVAKTAGREIIEKALIMYYATLDKDTPVWAKTVLIGALGYFICPIDAIPDAIPIVGYTDDLGAIAAALSMVAAHIKREHKEMAKRKVEEWFAST
jgi:uncharacterized membrane protein YkvA (DUF1232 family)